MKLSSRRALGGSLCVPGDKSISHRAVMFGSLAKGDTVIHNFLDGADCLSTVSCFRQMGIEVEQTGSETVVHGKGLRGLKKPDAELSCGNSGTTMRLISGILAGQNFDTVLSGDDSLKKRPMNRIITPLSLMGAKIVSENHNGCAPLHITGNALNGILYYSPVASAQVKSAILLAGLYAKGETVVDEPALSRDHTERMLAAFGADVKTVGTRAVIRPADELYAQEITVPGDISSAAFFIAAALMIPGSDLIIENVGINPTRSGILTVCKEMGAGIELFNRREESGEPVADLRVRSCSLHGTEIGGDIIPSLIDELPVITVLACAAEGKTVIRDAAELKVKESDRIAVMAENLTAMGADITPTEDGFLIHGGRPLHGAVLTAHNDHRVAMALAVAAATASGVTEISDAGCVVISYPDFFRDFDRVSG